ncbi:MYH6_7 [Lepeophtheirus salmonis]|uniref:MYH6_7 n=1 Tax=Lepeophtheirus salmonis TaxID=72036 RepID=A0A7R8CB68_LEPSM|nr:MYH6_7 [Lepeophtheirus salmonis]CAF2753639.1 MYH6_7 [Lepeophtheirus salmonis]
MVASSGKKAAKKVSLEDQIVATNPILESYGNAKTSRNDNSSRFGKFIRIHFTTSGKLAGCDIESYLLEKSRITQQQAVERSYHIFYQLLQPFVPNMREKCCLGEDIYDYSYVSQGKVKVESIDDNEELEYTFSAFDIIGFSERETWECFMLTAAVMSMGEMKFKQKGRDDQAEPDDLTFANKVADLMGVNSDEMMKAFCKPKIKVGTEWVTKGQTCDQANNGVGGIARSIYDRIFKWLIIKCNDTLIDTTMKKSNFVAVLDIAGFEIFEYNGFEQISINFVNEKLQQFFNHHMFVVEQEEYISEGIDWAMVDFGMDLAAAIIMFEKPMGIWAILEEESLFPKATDRSFEEKLKAQHLGKSAPFAKPQSKTDKNAHFAIIHYAGIVSYNVTGWLEKNKDPVNDTVVDVLKRSPVNELLVVLWKDHPGQSSPPEEKGKKKKKGGGGKTVSSVYLVQLTDLMNTLHSTEPHFIRCIVPNTHKKPLEVEPPLIMHQLTCNGVLEGIRICAAEISSSGDNKTGVFALMDKVKFDREKYRLGHTKVFFRAGALAQLEEARDEIVLKLVRFMQGQFYGFLKRVEYKKKADQRELLKVIQRNFRKYQTLRNWGWFIIIQKTRPLIGQVNIEEELRLLEEKAKEAYGAYEEQLKTKEKLEQESIKIAEEKKKLFAQIESEQGNLSQYTERQAKASAQRADLEVQLQESGDRLTLMERERHDATCNKKSLEQENVVIKKDIEDLELCIHRLEQEKTNRDHAIRSLNDDITHQDEIINRMNKEKKHMDEYSSKSSEELQTAEDKVEHLNKIKSKLEQTLDELEDSFEREKRGRAEIEKMRRKLEEKEISALNNKLEEDQCGVGKHQKHIKETQCRVEEMEEELEAERQARAKAERQRGDMARELEELSERLIEAGGATSAQIELNKKRESEVSKMRKDLEEIHIQQEATMQNLKRKHQDAVSEMSEQIDQLNKMKSKIDKDKYHIHSEIGDVRAAGDEISRSKAAAEKSNKSLLAQLNELNKKVEDSKLTVGDYENSKRRIGAENSDLLRQLQELENNASMLAKYKIQMASQLEEAKRVADDECKDRQLLFSKYRNLEHELDGTRYQLEEEASSKAELQRQFTKASHEADMWKSKFEKEGLAKAEELEMSKMKLQARLTESQGTIEQLNGKLGQLEKSKSTLQSEFEDMSAQADQAHILNSSMEKKARQFEKIVGEWKVKADSFSRELDNSQKECRNASSELFRVKNAYEEAIIQLDEKKRLESEKTELQAALEEAEGALEQEENKVLRSQLELNQVRQEIERRICEKEEEFQCTRKNFGKAIDQMQTALENETKSKAEALRMKKKLEADVSELETSLEHANAANMETQKTIKKYHQQIRESQLRLEDEQQAKEMARDEFLAADRKAHAHQNALEEARTLLEQADRVRRMTEQDLSDTNEQLSELTCQNQAIAGAQRKLGAEIQTLNAELDEMSAEARMSDDKAQKAMIDAAKLADELRREQEIAQLHERDCKVLECQAKDLQARVDETEANMLKSGRKAMNKMETRIQNLNVTLRKLTYATDEDRKNHERMQGLIDQLQTKFRQTQSNLAESEERADLNEAAFAKYKARERASSMAPL